MTTGFDPFRGFPGSESYGLEVHRTENGYQLEFPVPGFKPENISVTLEDRVLTVEGQSDRRRFTRALHLPDDIDGDSITADVEHGLLTIGLQLHPRVRPRKIDVQIGRGMNQHESIGRTVPRDSGAGGP
ncbi:MAG: Hsp20/alpha crystallin family protein [Candidatus Velthaea sp.]